MNYGSAFSASDCIVNCYTTSIGFKSLANANNVVLSNNIFNSQVHYLQPVAFGNSTAVNTSSMAFGTNFNFTAPTYIGGMVRQPPYNHVVNSSVWDFTQAQIQGAGGASGQTLTSSVATKLLLGTLNVSSGFITADTANSKIIIKVAGNYIVKAGLNFASNAVGLREVWIYVNGSAYFPMPQNPIVGDSTTINVDSGGAFPFSAGDYIELYGLQSSGGDLKTISPFLNVEKTR
jgi:hypothetical protein